MKTFDDLVKAGYAYVKAMHELPSLKERQAQTQAQQIVQTPVVVPQSEHQRRSQQQVMRP